MPTLYGRWFARPPAMEPVHRHLGRFTDLLSTPHLDCLFLCNHLLLKNLFWVLWESAKIPLSQTWDIFFFFHLFKLMSMPFPSTGNISIQRKLLCKVDHRARISLWHTFGFHLPAPRNSSFVHFLLRLAIDYTKFVFGLVSKRNCSRRKGIETDKRAQISHLLYLETKIYEGVLWEPLH